MGVSGLLVAGTFGIGALALTATSIPFVTPALRKICIPYVPATDKQLGNVTKILKISSASSPVVDLGSGDGRVEANRIVLLGTVLVKIVYLMLSNISEMKFGEQLSSHLTPEWRKQYIHYEELKSLLYELLLEMPVEEDARQQYQTQMDEKFFAQCEEELMKINLFFSQKIAEAQGKYHELSTELMAFKEFEAMQRAEVEYGSSRIRRRFIVKGGVKSMNRERAKTAQQLKLAFSEFYLSLVLVQNYQQLNALGFRKILKKHDKLIGNERGLDWRINRVEKSSFFLNREIETLISNVETSVINELEAGNRQAGMKRLKVPPLNEKEKASTTFSLGFFLGSSIILWFVIVFTYFGSAVRPDEPKWVAVRLFRGMLLFFLSVLLCGVNMYGWASAGVNHVLIFEVDPRNHLSYQSLMEIASFMCMLWSFGVLGYFYSPLMKLPPFLFPLLLMVICFIIMFNPLKKPEKFFRRNSRFWLIKHCFNCFTAPLHYVTFPDFWLGDQMNSLTTSFLDFQYFVCFYATEVDYSNGWLSLRTVNVTASEDVPWGFVDINTGRDKCTSASGVRAFVSIIPALVRFLQCVRRFRDTQRTHPHLVNAGKYATTFMVVAFKSLNHWAEKVDSTAATVFFYLWIFAYIVSFTFTFLWDVFMDWGLIDSRSPKDSPFLREEMIYGSKWYYYLAIAQDFILRLSWVLNVSLGEAWTLDSDYLTCITAPLEVFRRFIWNYFRLENEHVNNCGQFRVVRDISVKPIKKGDLETLVAKIDQLDGVSHRGQELRDRVKKQRKAAKAKRQILRKLPRVLQCAASGYHSVGLELNPMLVLYSKCRSRWTGYSNLAKFHRKNIFKADLRIYNTAIIFGAELMMNNILLKVDEMPLGSHLVACRFPLPDNKAWKLIQVVGEGVDKVWLYNKFSTLNFSH
uniref:SPX domain-containing protein n=1 Tax=Syphacia muris TaxID=451379 RepID=A0A0N5AD05_9BILA